MYRERGQVEADLAVLRDPLRDLLAAGRRALDSGDSSTAGYVLAQLDAVLARLRPALRLLDRWTAVLVAAAVADPDPLGRFRARYEAGHYARALEAVPDLPSDADPADVERYLHCLAETAETDQYLAALAARGHTLPGVTRTGRDRDRYPERLAAAVIAVHDPQEPQAHRSLGVMVGKRLALTTRRALTGGGSPRAAVPSAAAARASVAGIDRTLDRIILPQADVVDLAVAVLADPPSGHPDEPRPLRLGYSGLMRVGDWVQALVPVPQEDSTPDRFQLVDGTVERFEAFPELGLRLMRISLPTNGPAGAPVVNTAGELVGLLTGSDGDGAFAIATDTARSLLGRVVTD
jgi:molecular chaperone DnaK